MKLPPCGEFQSRMNLVMTIDLFLYEEEGKFHFTLIKNISRLYVAKLLQEQMNQFNYVRGVLLILQSMNY